MAKIRMLSTVRGSPDGATLHAYVEGSEHDLSHTPRERELADVFVREGWAELADAPKPEREPETDEPPAAPEESKDLGAAPENAAIPGAPENKAAGAPRSRRKPR